MKLILISAASALAASAGVAFAQEAPPPPPAEEGAREQDGARPEDNEIVVLATGGDDVQIDRRTYTLRDDPAAQATNMFDVLGRVPSVSVAPDGSITLLGADNVIVQINGQTVPSGNLEQILRGLQGSDVARIEVITNPGAQYSAQASGGIINIITRQRVNTGLNGSVQASADSVNGYHAGVSLNWTEGDWTFSGQAGVYHGEQDGSFDRVRETFASSQATTEDGRRAFQFDGWYASRLQAQYRFDDRRRASLAFDGGEFEFKQNQETISADTSGPLSTQMLDIQNMSENQQVFFLYEQDGERERETLKLNVSLGDFTNDNRNGVVFTPAGGGASHFETVQVQETTNANVRLDLEQPLAEAQFLTWGGAFDYTDQTVETELTTLSGPPQAPDYSALLDGKQQTVAAYATYQFETGDWTWLPGLRGETYRREVVSGGAESDTVDSRLFPTLHVRRALSPEINIDISYTSRISRPGIGQLDPAVRFVDVNRATSGNPSLKPTTTDAYEINLTYLAGGQNFSLTFYDRISDDIVSNFTQVTPDGVILSMPVNAGTSDQRGLQALLRGPLWENWRYSLSANLMSREFDFLNMGVIERRSEFEYDGNAQLDYRDADQNAIGANQFQLDLRFIGPRHGIQTEIEPFFMTNLTWRRRLTDSLFGVLMIHDVLDSTDQTLRVTTDDYFEETKFGGAGTRIRIALTWQFGSGPQRPMQDQPPMPQMPM